jgi:integrase
VTTSPVPSRLHSPRVDTALLAAKAMAASRCGARLAAGLPPEFRFHDLRHTCAALLIGEGHQQYEIMRHLGHSSITVTIDTHEHLFPSRAEAVADTLERVWAAAV